MCGEPSPGTKTSGVAARRRLQSSHRNPHNPSPVSGPHAHGHPLLRRSPPPRPRPGRRAARPATCRLLRPRFPEARGLAGELIERNWLTPYQANQLLQGRGASCCSAPTSCWSASARAAWAQVFKARNWKLGTVVALKLIRKEAGQPRRRAPLPPRDPRRRPARPSQHRPRHRRRRGGRHAPARHGVRPGRRPGQARQDRTGRCRWTRPATTAGRRRSACSTPPSAAWSIATSSRTTCC